MCAAAGSGLGLASLPSLGLSSLWRRSGAGADRDVLFAEHMFSCIPITDRRVTVENEKIRVMPHHSTAASAGDNSSHTNTRTKAHPT